MDWISIAKEGAALAMAGLLLWRFERMIRQRSDAESEARTSFLTALSEQRAENQEYLSNHLSANRDAQERVTEALGHLCEQQAVVTAIIQNCAKNGGND